MRGSILFICFALLFVGCKSDSARALREGNRLLNSRNPDDRDLSVNYFKKSIELEVKARNQLARAYFKIARKKMRAANRKITDNQIKAQTDALIKKQLGVAEATLQLFNHALRNFEEAVKILPNDKFTHYYIGLCYSQLSRSQKDDMHVSLYISKALAEYKIALRLDPDFLIARYGLSMIYLRQKMYKECVAELTKIIKAQPKKTRAYFALARVYYEMKEYRKSEGTYRMLLEMLPVRSFKRRQVKRNIHKLELLHKR